MYRVGDKLRVIDTSIEVSYGLVLNEIVTVYSVASDNYIFIYTKNSWDVPRSAISNNLSKYFEIVQSKPSPTQGNTMYQFLSTVPSHDILFADILKIAKPYESYTIEAVTTILTAYALLGPDFKKVRETLTAYEKNTDSFSLILKYFTTISIATLNAILYQLSKIPTGAAIRTAKLTNIDISSVYLAVFILEIHSTGTKPIGEIADVAYILPILSNPNYVTELGIGLSGAYPRDLIDVLLANSVYRFVPSVDNQEIHDKKALISYLYSQLNYYFKENLYLDLKETMITIPRLVYRPEETDCVPF